MKAKDKDEYTAVESLIAGLGKQEPFGPDFFLAHLGAFVRQQCPDPAEGLPAVELHLHTGEIMDVCHVIGLAPGWVALAVRDSTAADAPMRTELVRYDLISRVTVRPIHGRRGHIGFDDQRPAILSSEIRSAEEALTAAAQRPPQK
jgi:hypothetical protein